MPQWSIAEWRACIGGSWLATGRLIKTKSSPCSDGTRCIQRVLTVNCVVTMMSLTIVLIGINLLLHALLNRGNLYPTTDLLEFGILSYWNLYWINSDYLLLTVSTLLSLYEYFPLTIIMRLRQFACSLKEGVCLTSRLLCVLASLKGSLITCQLLLLANFVMNDHGWLRAVSNLRMMLIASDQLAVLEPSSSVVKEELELRDRGELLRKLALSMASLDNVLSVAVYVIIYKLLKSGDVEKNPGPGTSSVDYNSVNASQVLDEDDLSDVIEEVLSIQWLYYQLGRSLKLKIVDLDHTHCSNSSTEKALQAVLLLWLKQKYNVKRFGPPTWRMLVRAVDMKSGGNDHELAKQIASRHPATADCVQSPTPSQQANVVSKENPTKKESRENQAREDSRENSAKEESRENQTKGESRQNSAKGESRQNQAKEESRENSVKEESRENPAKGESRENSAKKVSKESQAKEESRERSAKEESREKSAKEESRENQAKKESRKNLAKEESRQNTAKKESGENQAKEESRENRTKEESRENQAEKESRENQTKEEGRENPEKEESREKLAKESRENSAKKESRKIPAKARKENPAKEESKENPVKERSEAEDLLGIDNVREVLDVLWMYRAKWRFVGVELRIKSYDLDAIDVDKRTAADSLLEVIKLWLYHTNPKPTRTFLTAVTQSELLVTEEETRSDHTQKAEEYTQYLKSLYRAQTLASFSDDQWPPPCTDKVVRLAMIKSEDMRRGHAGDDAVQREKTISGKVDDVLQRMVPVEIQDILKVKDQHKEVKKVLMEGAPGSGKSTLSFHMCRQWMEGHLFQEYKLVILVRLREPAVQNAESLAELLPRRNEESGCEIDDTITTSDGKGVLFILDGWDELPCDVPAHSLILDLVKGTKLPATSIIITSRPTSSAILHQLVHLQVEILGFTQDELHQYFTKCLENNGEAVQKLIQRIKQNPILEGSCYLPLNASILVHLFKHSGNALPTTQYGIFTDLVCTCIFRHLKKTRQDVVELESLDNLPRSTAAQFRLLCKIAYDGVMQDKVIFDLGPNFNTLGLLQGVESFAVRGKSYSYNFLHLSIQELLCAIHMADQLHGWTQTKIFKKLFGQPRFMLVFQFFAAKTKLKTSGISKVVKKVAKICSGDNPSYEDRTLLVSLMHCLFEAQDSSLCQLVANKLKQKLIIGTHNGSSIRLNPTDCYYLSYFLTFCDGFDVHFSQCSIGDDHCKSLFRNGEVYNFRSLNLYANFIGDKGAMAVAAAIKTATNLQGLYLNDNSIGDTGAMALAVAMETAINLQVVKLHSNPIGKEAKDAIGAAAKKMGTKIYW